MSNKYVLVPDPIVAVNPLNDRPFANTREDGTVVQDDPWTLHRFLVTYTARDGAFKTADDSRCLRRVLRAFRDAPVGSEVAVDVRDWRKVHDAIETPSSPYPGVITHQLIELMDAWAAATDHPRVEMAR